MKLDDSIRAVKKLSARMQSEYNSPERLGPEQSTQIIVDGKSFVVTSEVLPALAEAALKWAEALEEDPADGGVRIIKSRTGRVNVCFQKWCCDGCGKMAIPPLYQEKEIHGLPPIEIRDDGTIVADLDRIKYSAPFIICDTCK